MDLITKDSETTLVLFSSLDRVLENVEYVVMNYRPVLIGEHYLTGVKYASDFASANGLCRITGTRDCWGTCSFREKSSTGKATSWICWKGSIRNEILKTWNLVFLLSCFLEILKY